MTPEDEAACGRRYLWRVELESKVIVAAQDLPHFRVPRDDYDAADTPSWLD